MDDLMARVKRETREQHENLESTLPLGRSTFSLGEYRFVLEKFYGIYKPLEKEISEFAGLPQALQWEKRRKITSLEQDLRDVGLGLEAIAALPAARISAGSSLARVLGTMYVLEGATLGGQFISRAVGECLGFDNQKGCRFFSSYGPNVGGMSR